MGKRFDALRVMIAPPKRTNWKAAYNTVDVANRKQLSVIDLLRKQNETQMDSLKALSMQNVVLESRVAAYESAKIMKDPFRPVDKRIGAHVFKTGHAGNPWKCQTCGKGTRDLRHKGNSPVPVPTEEASDEALAIVEDLPGWQASVRTPDERGTDGYYVSGRSLNYGARNASKRRAYVHVFTCDKIASRREDSTITVVTDEDYVPSKRNIGRWQWGADMRQIRALAKAHSKYTKLCECVRGVVNDDADNSNGQIGSIITEEQGY